MVMSLMAGEAGVSGISGSSVSSSSVSWVWGAPKAAAGGVLLRLKGLGSDRNDKNDAAEMKLWAEASQGGERRPVLWGRHRKGLHHHARLRNLEAGDRLARGASTSLPGGEIQQARYGLQVDALFPFLLQLLPYVLRKGETEWGRMDPLLPDEEEEEPPYPSSTGGAEGTIGLAITRKKNTH